MGLTLVVPAARKTEAMQQRNRTPAERKNRPLAPPRAAKMMVGHYAALQQAYGRQHWWPARSRFEVILGAFLTQNTTWQNVELALGNLRRARSLSMNAIRRMPERKLARLIRPSGYFRQKAKRIKSFPAVVRCGRRSVRWSVVCAGSKSCCPRM